MKCPRCGNQDKNRFYKMNNRYYCRNCISFSKVYIDEYSKLRPSKRNSHYVYYDLPFLMSDMQRKISERLKSNYIHKKNSLVLAVCGSGKTEIVFDTIMYALNQGDRVCFCTPRKELCKELYERFKNHFYDLDVSLIYGGHIENLDSQFIICTTHQLYRFEHTGFHLIVLDEADAFPFYKNSVLEELFLRCAKGQYIKMSATIDENEAEDEDLLIMNRRYHFKDLPVPYKIIIPSFLHKFYLIYYMIKMKRKKKKVLIYVPSIKMVDEIVILMRKLHFCIEGIHSKTTDSISLLNSIREGNLDALVCTTILERGITIRDIQVIVVNAHHQVFDSRTLIQIAGRVGRKPDAYRGDVCFLAAYNTREMKRCIYSIKKLNKNV